MDHLYMEIMEKIKVKMPLDLMTLKMTKFSDIEDDYDDSLDILRKFKKGRHLFYHSLGFFLELMLENNQNDVNTFDFLNFIRPDTRYGKKFYEVPNQIVS